MEEEFDRPGFASSDPSDRELDEAIARAKEAAERDYSQDNVSELEDERGNGDEDDTASDDAPGSTDDEVDSEPVEANTPGDDEDEAVQSPQESRKKNSAPKQDGSDDETPNLSRKARGKIIEEYRRELESTEAERARLAEQVRKQQEAEEALSQEVSRALGTDAEYEKAVEDGLAGDDDAAAKARVWKANRAFYNKLVTQAGKTYQQEFAKQYWDTVNELAGVNVDEVTKSKDLNQIIRHIHAAGMTQAEEKYKAKIEKLENDVNTLKGRVKAGGPQAASSQRRSPITGGGASVTNDFDWKRHYLDADGMPTDEFEELVKRHGFEDVASGKYFKRGNK